MISTLRFVVIREGKSEKLRSHYSIASLLIGSRRVAKRCRMILAFNPNDPLACDQFVDFVAGICRVVSLVAS